LIGYNMAKTIKIKDQDISVDDNYYAIYAILEELLNMLKIINNKI